jgi:putative addiction module killer protein
VIPVRETNVFSDWMNRLRDARAKARMDRLTSGNPGDVAPVGEGVSELRIDYGPGYRVYFLQRARVLIVLLCGGDKRTQERDIRKAKELAREWRS